MKIFISELIGTFILSCALNFTADYFEVTKENENNQQNVSLIGVVIGFIIAIQFSRKISGAHLNPGVTLALYLSETTKGKKVLEENMTQYLGGQFIGGLLSPILSTLIIGRSIVLEISVESNYLGAFVMEFLGALVFYLMVLTQSSKYHKLTGDDEFVSSLVVAIGLGTGISLAGNESGAGLNPSISISQNLITFLTTQKIKALKYTIIYILAPVAASFSANWLYEFLNEEKFLNRNQQSFSEMTTQPHQVDN